MKTLLKNVNISNEIVILLKGIISTFEITLVRKFGATQTLTHVYVVCIYSYTYTLHTSPILISCSTTIPVTYMYLSGLGVMSWLNHLDYKSYSFL